MPSLSALYGLKWSDLVDMPKEHLDEYLGQLPDIHAALNGR
jgi:hypothetical protein